MDIKYQKHTRIKRQAMDFWLRVATDYNGGIPAKDIAKRYTNPKTQKPYTREHIYWILKKLNTVSLINNLNQKNHGTNNQTKGSGHSQ